VNRTPSTRRARCTISPLASTSPARASEQSRAATFSAPPPVAALDRYRLARVEPDPDRERKGWIGDRLHDEALLQSHGPSDRGARRAEDDQSLVTAQLEHLPPVILHHRAGHLREAPRQARGVLAPPFLCEGRVAADVGDQERVDVRVSAGVRLRLRTA
jgi:hypothetical protein